jgi:hypothetical protein
MKKIPFILITSILVVTLSATAANITSNASGNWSAASTWAAINRTGTLAYTNGSTAVTGTGTSFTTELAVGSILITTGVGAITRTVASITDNTHLTLTATSNRTGTGKSYTAQVVPRANDNVTISSGFTVTMDVANAYCTTLIVDGNQAANCSLTLSGTNTLTVAGAVSVNRPANLNVNAGTLNAASLDITGGTGVNVASVTITTGAVNITGNITFGGTIAALQIINFGGNGALSVGGTFEADGTLTAGAGTVIYNGSSAQVVAPYIYNNLTIDNASGASLTDTTIVNGILTLDSGVLDNAIFPVVLGPSGSVDYAGGSLNSPLPVEMTSFSAVLQGTTALLKWSTATETNNAGFQIERSVEGSGVWAKVAFVNGAGTSSSPKVYSYEDKNLAPGTYIYRIKQVDNDGTTTMYNANDLPKVDAGKSSAFQLCGNYPNPFNPTTTIQFSVPQDGYASLKVYNMLGQEVATLFSGMAKAGHYIPATFNASRFASGIYFARLQYNNQSLVQRMLMTK